MPLEGDALAAWLSERCGSLTASRVGAAIARKKDGTRTAEAIKLMHELLAERATGDSVRHYVNDAMQWGLDREDEAKRAYEAETGEIIESVGFVPHPSIEYFGATPDGLVRRDGLVETKCPTTPVFLQWKLNGKVPAEHVPQMIAQIACTGRSWCDFVAYDPRVRGGPSAQLLIVRFEPKAEEIVAVERAAAEFLAELEAMWDVLTASAV